jgi:FKBP-type peptidyl-prolyl cis-trans isomerase
MTCKPRTHRAALAAAILLATAPVAHAATRPVAATRTDAAKASAAVTRTGVAAPAAKASVSLDNDQQRTLYALGLALSQGLARLDLRRGELAYVVQGMQDGVLHRDPRLKLEDWAIEVQDLAASRAAVSNEREAAKAREFLARMASAQGALRTDSGIVIIAQQEGAGASPQPGDVVRVQYEGKLVDGTVFDSTPEQGEPASFALDAVIPCWTEALQHLKVGGRATIGCPPDLAFGEDGRPGIPPNAVLLFDVRLLGIGDAAATSPAATPARHPLLQLQAARR